VTEKRTVETQPLRALDQAAMDQLFATTDALEISREALRVALIRVGDGEVRRVRPLGRLAELLRVADEEATDPGTAPR